MAKQSMIDSNIINTFKKQIKKDPELELNHVYDMGSNWLVSIRTRKDTDLMDPYYIADKKTLKIKSFKLLDDLPSFHKALNNKVY